MFASRDRAGTIVLRMIIAGLAQGKNPHEFRVSKMPPPSCKKERAMSVAKRCGGLGKICSFTYYSVDVIWVCALKNLGRLVCGAIGPAGGDTMCRRASVPQSWSGSRRKRTSYLCRCGAVD